MTTQLDLAGKKILFIGPEFYDYHQLIINYLEKKGATVIYYPEIKFDLISKRLMFLSDRMMHLYQKVYLDRVKKDVLQNSFDYFLLIRGRYIESSFIQLLKARNEGLKTIHYQWDSAKNNNKAHLFVDFFDKNYSFDYVDCQANEKLKLLPLFHTAEIVDDNLPINHDTFDLSFICSFSMNRYIFLEKLDAYCRKYNLNLRHCMVMNKFQFKKYKYVRKISLKKDLIQFRAISKQEYFDIVRNSKAIVDYANHAQSGLSMRVIEAIGLRKKIITTNSFARVAGLGDSGSFLVIDKNKMPDIDFLNQFLNQKSELTLDVAIKYHIGNWIKTLFID